MKLWPKLVCWFRGHDFTYESSEDPHEHFANYVRALKCGCRRCGQFPPGLVV